MVEIGKINKMRQKVELILIYLKGIEVVKNTRPKYDIYINYNPPSDYQFYAAKNPEQYDPAGFDEDDDDGDSYMV